MKRPTALPRHHAAATGALLLGLAALAAAVPAAAAAQQPPTRSNYPRLGHIVRLDPRLDKVLPPGTEIEVLASGFDWSEGPVWLRTDPLSDGGEGG